MRRAVDPASAAGKPSSWPVARLRRSPRQLARRRRRPRLVVVRRRCLGAPGRPAHPTRGEPGAPRTGGLRRRAPRRRARAPRDQPAARRPGRPRRALADLQDPRSPRYHAFLTPEQFGARFGLPRSSTRASPSWLAAEGFAVTRYPNRLFIEGHGTVAGVPRSSRCSLAATPKDAHLPQPRRGAHAPDDIAAARREDRRPRHEACTCATGWT